MGLAYTPEAYVAVIVECGRPVIVRQTRTACNMCTRMCFKQWDDVTASASTSRASLSTTTIGTILVPSSCELITCDGNHSLAGAAQQLTSGDTLPAKGTPVTSSHCILACCISSDLQSAASEAAPATLPCHQHALLVHAVHVYCL